MKQITDLTRCPFCGHESDTSPTMCDSDYSKDNMSMTDIWECRKCLQSWQVEYKAVRVFYTVPDPDGVRDEIELGTVVDPQEGRDERERG